MKLNWFSPLTPAKSGIAEYTSQIIFILTKYAEVVLWTDQVEWDSNLEKCVTVRHYKLDDIPWLEINQADLNIYNIGNNPDFHHVIWQLSCKCPGLVVLHDFKLQDFFAGIYLGKQNNKDIYISKMKRYYGYQGQKAAEKFLNGDLTTNYMAEYYPLTYLGLDNAVGVVTHTIDAFRTLKQENRWFVGYVPLPYSSEEKPKIDARQKTIPYRLIMFGYIGDNRGLDFVLKALSTLKEKDKFCLDIYGHVCNESYILNYIKELGIDNLVTLHHGFVEEAKLEAALANADLAINLRYPTMGEASLSQLRIWSHGLPTLVTQVGWYAEQAEDTVAFVRPEHEIEDIQQHLLSFIASPEYFTKMGKNGQKTLKEKHDLDIYAKAIIHFAEESCKFRQSTVSFQLIEKIGEELSCLTNHMELNTQIERIAEAVDFISN